MSSDRQSSHPSTVGPGTISDVTARRLRRRNLQQWVLVLLGLLAVLFAFGSLFVLVASLLSSGHKAFTQTHITLSVLIDPQFVDRDRLPRGKYRKMLDQAMGELFTHASEPVAAGDILSNGAQFILRDRVVEDPAVIGDELSITVPVSDPYDQLNKSLINRTTPEEERRLNDAQIAAFDHLASLGMISKPFNFGLFFNSDSRFPELAGLKGALIGSFWALFVCFAISFPLGIGAAIYLEEFAARNRVSDFIEVNINNLASVPSVVFGLLALAVFIGWFGMPRSAPFVGGMTLALMTMPTIIIATRAALKAVPTGIREAALGVGASKHQMVFGHVLPLAMPGILTGTIIGLAQALGETAPLLLIGMNAFITSAPSGPFDTATALPTQIFIWADSPERGFVSRTSAAILVLLVFLIAMNAIAIVFRNRFEKKW